MGNKVSKGAIAGIASCTLIYVLAKKYQDELENTEEKLDTATEDEQAVLDQKEVTPENMQEKDSSSDIVSVEDPFVRQVNIDQFPTETLQNQVVLCLGVGGIGCGVAIGCARLGVEKLILVDFDVVASSNLNRQLLFSKSDVGKRKVDAACKSLLECHSICTEIIPIHLDAVENFSMIVDLCMQHNVTAVFNNIDVGACFDLAVNSLCRRLCIPYLAGSTYGWTAECTIAKNSPTATLVSRLDVPSLRSAMDPPAHADDEKVCDALSLAYVAIDCCWRCREHTSSSFQLKQDERQSILISIQQSLQNGVPYHEALTKVNALISRSRDVDIQSMEIMSDCIIQLFILQACGLSESETDSIPLEIVKILETSPSQFVTWYEKRFLAVYGQLVTRLVAPDVILFFALSNGKAFPKLLNLILESVKKSSNLSAWLYAGLDEREIGVNVNKAEVEESEIERKRFHELLRAISECSINPNLDISTDTSSDLQSSTTINGIDFIFNDNVGAFSTQKVGSWHGICSIGSSNLINLWVQHVISQNQTQDLIQDRPQFPQGVPEWMLLSLHRHTQNATFDIVSESSKITTNTLPIQRNRKDLFGFDEQYKSSSQQSTVPLVTTYEETMPNEKKCPHCRIWVRSLRMVEHDGVVIGADSKASDSDSNYRSSMISLLSTGLLMPNEPFISAAVFSHESIHSEVKFSESDKCVDSSESEVLREVLPHAYPTPKIEQSSPVEIPLRIDMTIETDMGVATETETETEDETKDATENETRNETKNVTKNDKVDEDCHAIPLETESEPHLKPSSHDILENYLCEHSTVVSEKDRIVADLSNVKVTFIGDNSEAEWWKFLKTVDFQAPDQVQHTFFPANDEKDSMSSLHLATSPSESVCVSTFESTSASASVTPSSKSESSISLPSLELRKTRSVDTSNELRRNCNSSGHTSTSSRPISQGNHTSRPISRAQRGPRPELKQANLTGSITASSSSSTASAKVNTRSSADSKETRNGKFFSSFSNLYLPKNEIISSDQFPRAILGISCRSPTPNTTATTATGSTATTGSTSNDSTDMPTVSIFYPISNTARGPFKTIIFVPDLEPSLLMDAAIKKPRTCDTFGAHPLATIYASVFAATHHGYAVVLILPPTSTPISPEHSPTNQHQQVSMASNLTQALDFLVAKSGLFHLYMKNPIFWCFGESSLLLVNLICSQVGIDEASFASLEPGSGSGSGSDIHRDLVVTNTDIDIDIDIDIETKKDMNMDLDIGIDGPEKMTTQLPTTTRQRSISDGTPFGSGNRISLQAPLTLSSIGGIIAWCFDDGSIDTCDHPSSQPVQLNSTNNEKKVKMAKNLLNTDMSIPVSLTVVSLEHHQKNRLLSISNKTTGPRSQSQSQSQSQPQSQSQSLSNETQAGRFLSTCLNLNSRQAVKIGDILNITSPSVSHQSQSDNTTIMYCTLPSLGPASPQSPFEAIVQSNLDFVDQVYYPNKTKNINRNRSKGVSSIKTELLPKFG